MDTMGYNQTMAPTYGMPRPDFQLVYGQPNPHSPDQSLVGVDYWSGINKEKDDAVNTRLPDGWITQTLLKRIRNINATRQMSMQEALNVCYTLNIRDVGQYDQDLRQTLEDGFVNVIEWINTHYQSGDVTKELMFIASMCGWEDYCRAANAIYNGGFLGWRTEESQSGKVKFIVLFGPKWIIDARGNQEVM